MVRKLFTVFVLVIFGLSLTTAADKKISKAGKPIIDMGPATVTTSKAKPVQYSTNAAAPILAAKMWNAYSPQSSATNLIAYDPYSNLVALVHRSDRTGPGSGYITYNVSDDGGANWTPQLGPLNPPNVTSGRHPNILLSNPSKSTSADNVQILIAENELAGGGFRDVAYLHDSAFTSALIHYFHDSSSVFAYAGAVDYNTGIAYYAITGSATYASFVAKTTDNGKTYTKKEVVAEADVLGGDGTIMLEVDNNGTVWYGMRASFAVDTVEQSWRFGYSTDGGDTWSTPLYLMVSDIPGQHIADYYEWDLIADASGNLHVATAFGDTTTGTAEYSLFDIVITKAGTISSAKIADIKRVQADLPGGLAALNEPEYARTLDGKSLVLKWVDVPAANDTMNDVYVVHKTGGAAWSAAANVSNSASVSELFSNLATIMKDDGQIYMYYTVFGPTDLDEAELYVLPTQVTLKVKPVNDVLPANFSLGQNYPNPFNPSTTISYNVPVSGLVEVGVFNMLGQQIATLVNEEHVAGQYTTSWNGKDANGLTVASGIYFYKLRAGQFESVKKMMLMK